jgi:hypothetical protein
VLSCTESPAQPNSTASTVDSPLAQAIELVQLLYNELQRTTRERAALPAAAGKKGRMT